ncbi:MAG TPA: sigma-70 family RNA polymerase sigma factor [Anaeromyxobacteraceae bacterium]|nr:sigma-70 family RNA polymerase sigma factor [Anaeromyxobacteraceae bacterium]
MTTTKLENLAPFLQAARGLPRLSREDERDLAIRAHSGDTAARDRLIRHNLALVLAVVRTQRLGTVRVEDVVQEGNLGLMRAVEKFDPHAGTRFSTYAVWWIRAYVGRYLKGARSNVRPRSGTVAQDDYSLDAPISDDDADASWLDRMEDERPDPEATYASSEKDQRLRSSLERVRARIGELGWDIVQNRLAQDAPETLETIGRRWDVSRERVRQVEKKTKELLARHLELEREAA